MAGINQEDFEAQYFKSELQDASRFEKLRVTKNALYRRIKTFSLLNCIYSFVPILHWLPKYRWREDLHGDIIGGLTVGIMHVPQGMAYASLASLPPVYGLYSSFFASSVYAFFGTSRHVSIGVFAVASMMVGAVRLRLVPDTAPAITNESLVTNYTALNVLNPDITPIMLTSALTLAVGIVQITMAVLHLGFLTTYLSDALVSGFTTGAACHVFMSQLNKVIGVNVLRYSGTGMLFFMLRDIILAIPRTNFFALTLSVFGMIFLKLGKDVLNPIVKRHSPIPLPMELLLVIFATAFSSLLHLKANYGVHIVDYVPQGVPKPSMPRIDLLPQLMGDAVGIAVVCYMFVISMAKLFAKKRKYKIDPGQELYAVGFMSLVSSLFPVYPTGASLSRSSVCEQSGARTQLYTFFSSLLLLTVIVWMGPLLEPLPMCILASIVIVSLESLFLQVKELPRLWKVSKFDFMVWVVSCIATMTNSVMTGLVVALGFNILSLTLREQWPKLHLLGRFPTEGIYKPESYYTCLPTPNESMKLIRFEGPLHFANVGLFKEKLNTLIMGSSNENPINDEMSLKRVLKGYRNKTDVEFNETSADIEAVSNRDDDELKTRSEIIIIDCSAIPYIDNMGLDALTEVYSEAAKVGVQIYLANVSETILDIFRRIDFFTIIPKTSIFPNIHQAVTYLVSV